MSGAINLWRKAASLRPYAPIWWRHWWVWVAGRMGEHMAAADNRWWGPRSDFPWEEDALKHVRNQMPAAEPYRAWHTFTFTAQTGHVREVDLLVAAPAGLF